MSAVALSPIRVFAVAKLQTTKVQDVAELNVTVAVLAEQHEHVSATLVEIKDALKRQDQNSDEFRRLVLANVQALTTEKLPAMEAQIAKISEQVSKITEKGIWNWLRKNIMILGTGVAITAALIAAIKWFFSHFHWKN